MADGYCTGCGAGRTRRDHAPGCKGPAAILRGGPVRGKLAPLDPVLLDALRAARSACDAIPPERWRAVSIGLMRKLAREHPNPSVRKLAADVVADFEKNPPDPLTN